MGTRIRATEYLMGTPNLAATAISIHLSASIGAYRAHLSGTVGVPALKASQRANQRDAESSITPADRVHGYTLGYTTVFRTHVCTQIMFPSVASRRKIPIKSILCLIYVRHRLHFCVLARLSMVATRSGLRSAAALATTQSSTAEKEKLGQ